MSNYCQTAAAHWKPKREAEDKREGGRRRGRGGGGRGGRRGSRRGHEARKRRKRTKEQAQAKNRTVTTPSNQTRQQAGRFCCWLLLKCCSIAVMPASLLLDCYWILHVFQPSNWTFRLHLVLISFLISFFPGLDSLAMSMPISQPSHARNV